MTEINLFCDVPDCGHIAQAIGIKGTVKEKCCGTHLQLLINKGMSIFGIAGYHFISSFEDAAVFEERKTKVERGLGFLTVLESQCDSEFSEAERVLDASEKRVAEIVTRSFQEIRLQGKRKFEAIKQELGTLRNHFDQYLGSRNSELTESAQLLCESRGTPLKWVRLMNEDCSAEVGKVIFRSWRISTESVETSLSCLNEKKRATVLEHLGVEASELLKEGHAQFALQLSLYARTLGWEGDIEEARKANLSKQFEDLTSLRALLPSDDTESALALEVAAQCSEFGLAAKDKKQFDESAFWLQKAWQLYSESGVARASSSGLALGEVLGLCCGKYAEAEEIVRQCYNIAARLDPLSEEVLRASVGIAGLSYHSGRWRNSEEVCEWVLCSFESGKYSGELFWTTLLYLTHSCSHQGNEAKAQQVTKQWSEKQLIEGGVVSEVLKLIFLATSAQEKRNYAERVSVSALKNLQVSAPALAATIFNSMGVLCKDLKRWDEAEGYLKRAKEIYGAVAPQSIEVAINLNNFGLLYYDVKRLNEAEEHYKRAKEMYDAMYPQNISAANNLQSMGVLYKASGQWKEAEKHYKCAKEIYDAESPHSVSAASNLSSMGVLYHESDQLSEAEKCYKCAREIYRDISPQSISAAINLQNIGVLYKASGQWKEAEEHYMCAKEIYDSMYPQSISAANNFNCLGVLCKDSGKWEEAEGYYKHAKKLFDSVSPQCLDAAIVLNNMGYLYEAMGKPNEAISAFMEAKSIYSVNHSNESVGKCEIEILKLCSM